MVFSVANEKPDSSGNWNGPSNSPLVKAQIGDRLPVKDPVKVTIAVALTVA